jgi:hypothetical protein
MSHFEGSAGSQGQGKRPDRWDFSVGFQGMAGKMLEIKKME